MAEANDTNGIIYQNLVDAGCDEKTIAQCMTIVEKGTYAEMLPILSQHRSGLLLAVHSGQRQIDCLDYLIYKIQNNSIS